MKYIKSLAILAFASAFLWPLIAQASFVAPKRVMIDHGHRAGGITIYNKSDKPLIYTFEWERRAQSPDGKRVLLKDGETLAGYKPADEYLIFSPRRVVVQPGEFQRLRILARRPADLAEGEYHSHIKIMPEPLEETNVEIDAAKGLGGQMEVKAHLSMPVFLRHGKTQLNFDLTNIKLYKEDGRDYVSFVIKNDSTRSVYARHVLTCTIGEETAIFPLGTTRVYAEAKSITDYWPTPKKAPPLESCESLTLNVYGMQDFEYKRNEPIKTYRLK